MKRLLTATVIFILFLSGMDVGRVAADDLGDWASRLGVSVNRLEVCPGESMDDCVHLKDGDIISVQVPGGFRFEGWDGQRRVEGNGPTTLRVAGLTVRRSTAATVAPAPVVSDDCSQESMIVASMRPVSGSGDLRILVDVGIPAGFEALILDGQEVSGGPHVFRIFGSPVTGWPIVQGTWFAVCGSPSGIALRIATQPGDQVWDMRFSPPVRRR